MMKSGARSSSVTVALVGVTVPSVAATAHIAEPPSPGASGEPPSPTESGVPPSFGASDGNVLSGVPGIPPSFGASGRTVLSGVPGASAEEASTCAGASTAFPSVLSEL